jgi:hypothetical protein
MSIRIEGWPEGHPHLTNLDDCPFGLAKLTCPYPLACKPRDGYASSFMRLYRRYKNRATKRWLIDPDSLGAER